MLEYKKRTDMDLLFPEQSFEYQGLTVVVKGLPARRVLKLASLFRALRAPREHKTGSARSVTRARLVSGELLLAFRADMVRLLEESVEIPGMDMGVLDLPFRIFPRLLQAFLEVNFDLGNWHALGRALGIETSASSLIESLTSGASSPHGVRS
jgi:hypothetical protein